MMITSLPNLTLCGFGQDKAHLDSLTLTCLSQCRLPWPLSLLSVCYTALRISTFASKFDHASQMLPATLQNSSDFLSRLFFHGYYGVQTTRSQPLSNLQDGAAQNDQVEKLYCLFSGSRYDGSRIGMHSAFCLLDMTPALTPTLPGLSPHGSLHFTSEAASKSIFLISILFILSPSLSLWPSKIPRSDLFLVRGLRRFYHEESSHRWTRKIWSCIGMPIGEATRLWIF